MDVEDRSDAVREVRQLLDGGGRGGRRVGQSVAADVGREGDAVDPRRGQPIEHIAREAVESLVAARDPIGHRGDVAERDLANPAADLGDLVG